MRNRLIIFIFLLFILILTTGSSTVVIVSGHIGGAALSTPTGPNTLVVGCTVGAQV